MRASNQCEAVVMIERFRNILTEGIAGTSWRYPPPTSIIRIRPQQIAHRALVRNFLNSVEGSDVIQRIDTRRETTVQAENLIFDKCGERKVIEEVGEVLPNTSIAILAKTFVVKAVYLSDLAGFVVTTQNSNALRVANFESDKKRDRLNGEVATVYVITCSMMLVVASWLTIAAHAPMKR